MSSSQQCCLTPREGERDTETQRGRGAQKLKDIMNCAAVKKYNEIGADKVRKSRASYENIYHSTNAWLQRGLELICVFLRGGALRYRMGNSPQAGTFWAAAYSQFIRASNRNREG